LTKPPYVTLAGVAMFVVLPRLASPLKKVLFGTAIAVCALLAWLWGREAIALFVPGNGAMPIDPVAQAHHIIEMPLTFIALVVHTIRLQYLSNYQWMVGVLGWGDTPMPGWFYPTFGFGVLACVILESPAAGKIGWRLRIVMLLAGVISVFLIYAALYSDWNPPGSQNPIGGIEGRFFLPLLPLFVLSFPAILGRPTPFVTAALASILSVLAAAVCLWAVIFRYYVAFPEKSRSGQTARLTNFSTRALVGNKEHILVSGFAVGGHGKETVLICAEGPSLSGSGISGVLAQPSLSVQDSNGTVLASNTGWGRNSNAAQIAKVFTEMSGLALPPKSADSALELAVPDGRYTVLVSGADGASGMAKLVIYEVTSNGTRLVNFSSRGYVGKGGNMMVVGFSVGGKGSEALLGRADGPSLSQFGVIGTLSQPTIDLSPYPSGDLISAAWGTSPAKQDIASAASTAGAFPLIEGSADSAAVFSLPQGAYTMKVFGVGGTTGVALAEIYELR
jgi:hypothetical protein